LTIDFPNLSFQLSVASRQQNEKVGGRHYTVSFRLITVRLDS